VKVLIAGLGSIGQRHVRNLRALLGDDLELLAYRTRGLKHVITPDMRAEPGSDVNERYGLHVFTDLAAALAQRPDAVFVTNPNSMHMPVALAAARAGCHLFIEKPVSHDLDGIDELARAIDAHGVTCFVAYQFRFHPVFTRLQSLLAANAIGPVIAARLAFGEYLPGWHPYEDYRQMPVSRREMGGGVVLAQVHDLDCAFALFGLPRRLFALGGHLSGLDIDVEDTASILMECESGGRRIPVHLHQDMLQRPTSRTYEVVGECGKVVADFTNLSVRVFDSTGQAAQDEGVPAFERNQLFLDEVSHFLDCLREDATPLVTLHDGVQSLRMALAARESMETGRVVALEG